jgi:hypothetical protein
MMLQMKKIYLIVIIIAIAFSACKSDKKTKKERLPHSIGHMGELIVVADENMFKGTTRQVMDSVLDAPQPYFYNVEGYFRIRDITPQLFRNVSKSYHTLWIIKVRGDNLNMESLPAPYNILSDSLEKINDTVPVRTYQAKNIWAYPQQILFIYAKSTKDLYKYLWENRFALRQKTLKMEMESHKIKVQNESVDSVANKIKEPFGFTMAIPQKFRVARYEEKSPKHKFMWIRRETPNIGQSILIYTQPYTREGQLKAAGIVVSRDSVTKRYIPGPVEGCYMGTELNFPYTSQVKDFAGAYAVEMRAWWKTYNCFMGGPFYSMTIVDEKHGVLLTVEGFVYSPKYDKTQYIRQLEAMIKTFKWL